MTSTGPFSRRFRRLCSVAAALGGLACSPSSQAPSTPLPGAPNAKLGEQLAIRAVFERLTDAINHHEWQHVEALLTEDVVWEALPPVGFKLDGLSAVRRFFQTNEGKVEVLRYEMFAPRIAIEGARATVRSTMRELLLVKGQSTAVELVGTYTDELVLRSGTWRIARRTFQLRYEDDVPIPKRLGGSASRMSAADPSSALPE